MPHRFTNLLLLVLACGALAVAEVPHHAKSQKASSKPSPVKAPQTQTAQTKAAPAAQQPQAAPAPVMPENQPSSPPDVNLRAGQLTIIARNSTLGDVLNAVKQKTGASVDMPPASSERVVGQFGPGAPREVLAQLLNGSHYDYVLVGSPADPGALKKIVLMAKASGPEPAPPPQQGNEQPNEPLQAVPDVEQSESPDEGASEPPAPMIQQPEEEQPPSDQPDQQQGQPVVKTPEQLLRELQQQQQQQQQEQQNQSGPPGAPGQPPQQ